MEATYAFLKQNALSTILVVAVLSANGQIWLLNNRIQGLDDEIQDLRADMVADHQAIRAEMVNDPSSLVSRRNDRLDPPVPHPAAGNSAGQNRR